MAKTTKKEFEIFKSECQMWIDKFELNNWSVFYEWKGLDSDAYSVRDISNHNATIGFSTSISNDFDMGMNRVEYIKYCAKHEIIHLLIGRLACYGYSKDYTTGDIEESEEELVIKLLYILK